MYIQTKNLLLGRSEDRYEAVSGRTFLLDSIRMALKSVIRGLNPFGSIFTSKGLPAPSCGLVCTAHARGTLMLPSACRFDKTQQFLFSFLSLFSAVQYTKECQRDL